MVITSGKLSHLSNMWSKGYAPEKITNSDELEKQLRDKGFLFKNKSASVKLQSAFNEKSVVYSKRHEVTYRFEDHKDGNTYTCAYLNDLLMYRMVFCNQAEVSEFKKIVGI